MSTKKMLELQTTVSKRQFKENSGSWVKINVDPENFQPRSSGMIFLQCLVGILFFVFVIRFWYLQVHKGQDFAELAMKNRLRENTIIASRGLITDQNNVVLAGNKLAYGLSIIREDCQDINAILVQISAWTGVPLNIINAKYEKDKYKVKPFEPLLLLNDIDFDLVARIEAQLLYWPGLEIVVRLKRNYLPGNLYSHLLGYVAETNEKEMSEDRSLAVGDLVGKQGLELIFEEHLRGDKGLHQIEVDVFGRAMSKRPIKAPYSGQMLKLTIDSKIQQVAWDALEGQAGCVVVMDPDTGKLIALVTAPAYNNNSFASGISNAEWDKLRTNPRSPMQNRVIQSVYPPASIWKLMMTALFLKEGIKSTEKVFCSGSYVLGDRTFGCWKKGGHGQVDMTGALVYSCDVYFYHYGDKMGVDRIEKFAKLSGFGKKTGIDLPYEKAGLVPSKKWKKRRFNQSWVGGETLNISIGQGFTLVTPLQIATFISSLLNGGKLLKPLIVENALTQEYGQLPVQEKIRSFIVDAMRSTVQIGTAKGVARKDADMGGKTGTAQVVKLKMLNGRRLKADEMEYAHRDHAWIATWGVKHDERFVVIVMVEHGGGGASVAGPIAKKIYEALFGNEINELS